MASKLCIKLSAQNDWGSGAGVYHMEGAKPGDVVGPYTGVVINKAQAEEMARKNKGLRDDSYVLEVGKDRFINGRGAKGRHHMLA